MSERVSVIHDEDRKRILIGAHDKLVAMLSYDEAQKLQAKINQMLPKISMRVTAFMQSLTIDEPLPGQPYSVELTLKIVNLTRKEVEALRAEAKQATQALDVTMKERDDL